MARSYLQGKCPNYTASLGTQLVPGIGSQYLKSEVQWTEEKKQTQKNAAFPGECTVPGIQNEMTHITNTGVWRWELTSRR